MVADAHRFGRGVGIGLHKPVRVGDEEGRVRHGERAGDVFVGDGFEIGSLDLHHHGAEHVDGDGVEPHGSGREGEAGLDHAGEVFFHGEVAVDAGGDLQRVVGPVLWLEEIVREARRVGEQVVDGDGGCRAVRRLRLEVGQEVGDGAAEAELAKLDHAHRGGGDDGLGDGGEAEDVVFLHGAPGLAVRLAIGLEVGELPVLHHGDDGADDALFAEGCVEGGVDAGCHVCHGAEGDGAPGGLSRGDVTQDRYRTGEVTLRDAVVSPPETSGGRGTRTAPHVRRRCFTSAPKFVVRRSWCAELPRPRGWFPTRIAPAPDSVQLPSMRMRWGHNESGCGGVLNAEGGFIFAVCLSYT